MRDAGCSPSDFSLPDIGHVNRTLFSQRKVELTPFYKMAFDRLAVKIDNLLAVDLPNAEATITEAEKRHPGKIEAMIESEPSVSHRR